MDDVSAAVGVVVNTVVDMKQENRNVFRSLDCQLAGGFLSFE